LWAETIGPGGYAARRLPRGATVRLTDVDGDACANVLVYSARNPIERLNVADTVKVQWQAYLGPGALLLSDQGRVLMSIVADTSSRHDALCGVSTRRANEQKYGSGDVSGPHPNGRDQFAVAVAKLGLARRDVVPNVNLFKHVRVLEHGELCFDPAPPAPGAYVELRAEQPVYLVVANTPHVLDPRADYVVTPVGVVAWRGSPTTRADALWSAMPERERAFLNTEDALLEDDE
jgi:urea carboxylase-associated protein 2